MDVVQEVLLNALQARAKAGAIENVEAWLFRIAHNAALDFPRRRARHQSAESQEVLEMVAAPVNLIRDREIAATSLHTFMRLPPRQRSAIILKDVLGHSLEEICAVTGGSLPSEKSALQRGQARLREFSQEPENSRGAGTGGRWPG